MIFAAQAMEEEGAPWELLYNLGTALVQRGAPGDDAAAESCLEQAEEVCREVRVATTMKRGVIRRGFHARVHSFMHGCTLHARVHSFDATYCSVRTHTQHLCAGHIPESGPACRTQRKADMVA